MAGNILVVVAAGNMVAAAVADSMVALVAAHSLHRADKRAAAQDMVVVLGRVVASVDRTAPMGRMADMDMDYFARILPPC